MSLERLGRQNPWWENAELINNDPHIVARDQSPLKWSPEIRLKIKTEADLIYALRGPRQVGKTTLLKSLIRNLLRKKINPRRIIYIDCERLGSLNYLELSEVIEGYLNWIRTSESSRLYLFIDEINFIKDWAIGIKILADAGSLRNVFLIVTGSHAIDIKRGMERLPGRRGKEGSLDLLLLPMSFREYLSALAPEIEAKLPQFETASLEEVAKIREALIYSSHLYPLFDNYLRSGGFPISASEVSVHGSIPMYVFNIYKDAIISDLQHMGRKETLFRDLLSWIFNQRENPFDWTTAARESGIGKHDTARDYLEDAESAFAWFIIYRSRNISRFVRSLRSPKKLVFMDPFIFHSLRTWSLGYSNPWEATIQFLQDPYNLGYLVESVVGSHLKRRFSNLAYWRNKLEIDFLVFREGGKVLPIEVKYQTRVGPRNQRAIHSTLKSGIILTRNFTAFDDQVISVPTPIFLSLLE
ncbi:hypothetical protein DRP53_04700 [candidate division WOR-3 bacterium]|uniref:AAA+ ATPase domain-containing protein n=1 Tax=candidate division WOR-3 bacterium TaxID=2052148 RepID=A0A660SID1_UNCW3|nr:MAG: hypothetical protein DRP53_04700 [candidate division WOR-3 bacterium]